MPFFPALNHRDPSSIEVVLVRELPDDMQLLRMAEIPVSTCFHPQKMRGLRCLLSFNVISLSCIFNLLWQGLLAALNPLRNIFGLGRREAESIAIEVTSQVYRKRLRQVVSSGTLAAAASKADNLQNLCEELHFDPQKAVEIHEEIYRKRLQQLVADKGELSDQDLETLEKIQTSLCITKETIDAIHADICGSLFEKSLFYSALLCAREMLIPEEVPSNLVQELNNRLVGSIIKSLNFVQQLLEYTRPFRVNLVLYYLIVESFPCILSERSMQF